MTRLAVLADIHGNLPAFEAVLADIDARGGADQVVIAGDLVNWGPFSAQVMTRVTREDWALIRGNNEYYLLDYKTARQPEHWRSYSLLPWLYEQLAGRWHRVIASWPDELSLRFPDAPPIRMFHGLPGDPWRGLHPLLTDTEIGSALAGVEETTVIAGHTHLAMDRRAADWHVINPGSVGVPLDGELTASYALLEGSEAGWEAQFFRLPFDHAAVLREFERQRFVERYGVIAQLVVREFERARLQVHPFNHWQAESASDHDSELLAAFDQIDQWAYTPPEYHINQRKGVTT